MYPSLLLPSLSYITPHPIFQEVSLHSCLQLYLVSVCVYLLGARFKPLIQLVVYPLLQRLGEDDVAVATAAHSALNNITLNCGYK